MYYTFLIMDQGVLVFFLFIPFLGGVSFILILVRKSVDFGFRKIPRFRIGKQKVGMLWVI